MTAGSSNRVVLGFAITIASTQAGLGAWFTSMAIEARDGYFLWAAIILAGGLAAVAVLIIIPNKPKIERALTCLGSLFGVTMWISIVGILLICLLMPAILGVTVIHDGMKASAVGTLVVCTTSILLPGVCISGLHFGGRPHGTGAGQILDI